MNAGHNIVLPPENHRNRKKTGLTARATFLFSLIPLLIVVIGACTHVMFAIVLKTDFGWGMFAMWLVALVAATLFWMLVSWRQRRHLETWLQLLVLDAGGTFLWYWAFAPIYQYLILNLSVEQSAVNAFAFFWEVPLVGGLACLFSQWQFRSLAKYVRTGHTDNPAKLYHHADTLPLKVMLRNSVAATLGFVLGAFQIHNSIGMSGIEVSKDVMLGLVVSIFVSLYYYLVFYILIGPIKSRLADQYKLKNIVRTKYHFRVLIIIVMISLGSLSLMCNLYVNNFQKSVRETVKSDAGRRLSAIHTESQLQNPATLDSLKFGNNGVVYTLPLSSELPINDLSRKTIDTYDTSDAGWIQDEGARPKLIGYKIVGSQKLVTVVYVNDFYGPLLTTIKSLFIGAFLVMAVTLGATLIFVRVLARTLNKLDAAVADAHRTGKYRADITTGDEFEDLSRSFGHFVKETRLHSKQLSEEHARLEASLYSLPLGMIITDNDGSVININESAQNLLFSKSYTPKNVTDIDNSATFELKLSKHIMKSIKNKEPINLSSTTFGTKFMDIFIAPISTASHQHIGTITVLQDTSEAHILQRSRDEFFSIASHELRTPLTAIRGNAQLVQQFYEPVMKKNPGLQDMLADVYDSSVRLIDIVNDFLDVSRLEQGKVIFKMSEFKIDRTIEKVAYDMQASIKSKKVSLTINKKTLGALPPVWADEGRTKQVLYNLIGNAAKFTEKGSITIDATVSNVMIKVTVTDTGPGIPAKMQKLLFHKFQQAGASLLTRDGTKGTGLGLYISKSIIESMGGRIVLESSVEGEGTTFSFTLPIATDKLMNSVKNSNTHEIDIATGLTK